MVAWATVAAPSGWLLCDGASYLRATYPVLFAAIGTTYGAADGTHFAVPDLRGRFVLGLAAAGTGSALGGTGGNLDHVHSVNPPATTSGAASAGTSALPLVGSSSDPNHTHSTDIVAFDSAAANPPFMALPWIIRT